MNNKDGFTLVELLAVVAILAILALLVTPAVMAIRQNTLERSLAAKFNQINSAAKDWASDHLNLIPSDTTKCSCSSEGSSSEKSDSCITGQYGSYDTDTVKTNCCYFLKVRNLIEQGYLVGDSGKEKDTLLNPLSDESLNSATICIRFDNNSAMTRKVVTYIVGETCLLNGTTGNDVKSCK